MDIQTFLVDTNVLSNLRKKSPDIRTAQWIFHASIAIPFPVIMEIEFGISSRRRTDPEKAEKLRVWLDWLLTRRYEYPPMTPDVARLQATMLEEPTLKNLWCPHPCKRPRPPGQDVFIAAVAKCYGLPIATYNTKDFVEIDRSFPLHGIYNPATDEWARPPCSAFARSTNDRHAAAVFREMH